MAKDIALFGQTRVVVYTVVQFSKPLIYMLVVICSIHVQLSSLRPQLRCRLSRSYVQVPRSFLFRLSRSQKPLFLVTLITNIDLSQGIIPLYDYGHSYN